MFKTIVSIVLILLIIATPVMANIDNVLDNVVSGAYVQKPGAYKSPSYSTMSMGSMSFRLKNDVLGKPVFSLRPPRANLSCSGMDFDAGMIS
ncbi:MAG: conjugal transfer protein TraH, partial [Nitrospirae bacterium]|nr:conjugal transfer protein TraH [Nitrospirota bacterium]